MRKLEWEYQCKEESVEDLAAYIISNAACMMRILEVMEEEQAYDWLPALEHLVQSTWAYARIISDKQVLSSISAVSIN